jgi:hypothetical protein
MMIRTKLRIVIYLCAILAAISSIAVIYSLRHLERKVEERRDIHVVVRGIFDLTILADEYLISPSLPMSTCSTMKSGRWCSGIRNTTTWPT